MQVHVKKVTAHSYTMFVKHYKMGWVGGLMIEYKYLPSAVC